MPRTVYYSKKYTQQHTAKMSAIEPAAEVNAAPQKGLGKLVPLIMLGCLVLALLSVLVIPPLVAGAAGSQTPAVATPQNQLAEVVEYAGMQQAAQAVSEDICLPATLPEGYEVTASRVVNGEMLELVITKGRETLVFRAAPGSEDLSEVDYETSAYTLNEEVNGITRGYAGVSDKKLTAAVWIDDGYSYALVADGGMDAQEMRTLAESIA